jgi:hypothetical protein
VLAGTLVAPFGLDDLQWLALGACLVAAGFAWMGLLLATGRTGAGRPARPAWPPQGSRRQFRF